MGLFFEQKRSELPDNIFGVPEQRKFPLDSEEHLRSAIKFFNYVDSEYEEELARNIKKAMKKYHIDDVHIGKSNRLSKYIKTEKKEKVTKESSYLIESIEGERDPYETYNKYRIEPLFIETDTVTWDEGSYFSNIPDAVLDKIQETRKTPSGKYYVYTYMGIGKTKFIGVIDVLIRLDRSFTYEWTEKTCMVKEVIENASSTAIVGTNGNIFISGFMKHNTFVDTPDKEMDYVVHRDGFHDIFHYDNDGGVNHLNKHKFLKENTIICSYQYIEPLEYTNDYFSMIEASHSIQEFYTKLMKGYNIQESFINDTRLISITPFTKVVDKIQRDIFYEYQMIKEKNSINNLVIEEVNQNIQSLIDEPYRPGSNNPLNESSGSEDKNQMMVEQLKILKEIIPTIAVKTI